MLDVLTTGFKAAADKLRGKATLNESNLAEAMEQVRRSLLDADVEYTVVKTFLKRVSDRAIGQTVDLAAGKGSQKVRVGPREHFVQICQHELESLMEPRKSS